MYSVIKIVESETIASLLQLAVGDSYAVET